jgi:hypothetical protein
MKHFGAGPVKQQQWREQQVDVLYRTGRPIFNINQHTAHLRGHNNPAFYKDLRTDFWKPVFIPYTKHKGF